MKLSIIFFSQLAIACNLFAPGEIIAAQIETITGKQAENISDVSLELDGRIKITHDAGIWRISQQDLTLKSQQALHLEPIPESIDNQILKELTTLDGKRYTGISRCTPSASELKIIHSSGSASLRFENLPEAVREMFKYDPAKAKAYDLAVASKEYEEQKKLLDYQISSGPIEARNSEYIFIDCDPPSVKGRSIQRVTRAELFVLSSYSASSPWVWVEGYRRSDGVWIPSHYRTHPDFTDKNNWVTIGNKNPFTGEYGDELPSGYSGSTYVRPYTKKDGTHVSGHYRKK